MSILFHCILIILNNSIEKSTKYVSVIVCTSVIVNTDLIRVYFMKLCNYKYNLYIIYENT